MKDALFSAAERFGLQLAQLDHVPDALGRRFDMAVEHRGVGIDPQLVGGAMHFEPAILADFSLEDFIVNAVVENLRPAAGQAAEARIAQGDQNFPDAQIGAIRLR